MFSIVSYFPTGGGMFTVKYFKASVKHLKMTLLSVKEKKVKKESDVLYNV